ncbi:hypothetical protein ACSQ67_018570 [Phaseolus vulgaris]
MGNINNSEIVGEGFTIFILIFYSNLLQFHAHHRPFSDTLSHCHPPLRWPPPGICLKACESGSIFEGLLPEGLNIYATTSAKAEEDRGIVVMFQLCEMPSYCYAQRSKEGLRMEIPTMVPPSKVLDQRDEDLIHFWDKLLFSIERDPEELLSSVRAVGQPLLDD